MTSWILTASWLNLWALFIILGYIRLALRIKKKKKTFV